MSDNSFARTDNGKMPAANESYALKMSIIVTLNEHLIHFGNVAHNIEKSSRTFHFQTKRVQPQDGQSFLGNTYQEMSPSSDLCHYQGHESFASIKEISRYNMPLLDSCNTHIVSGHKQVLPWAIPGHSID